MPPSFTAFGRPRRVTRAVLVALTTLAAAGLNGATAHAQSPAPSVFDARTAVAGADQPSHPPPLRPGTPSPKLALPAPFDGPGAMDELIRGTYTDVYALCRRLLGDPSDAADATQEVYLRVVRSILAFRGEDRLFVPHEQVGKLSRYVGADASAPALSKLGGKAWHNLKARARASVRELAGELHLVDAFPRLHVPAAHAREQFLAYLGAQSATFDCHVTPPGHRRSAGISIGLDPCRRTP